MVLEQSPYVASAALEISRKIPATNGESFDGLEVYHFVQQTVCLGNRESFEQVLEGWALAIRTHSSRQGAG